VYAYFDKQLLGCEMDEPKPDQPKSRFVGRWKDLHFMTKEEADARVAKRRAELAAFHQKWLREASEEKARQQAKSNEHGNSDEKKS